jgi:ATP-dependent Lhr-like helicase
MWFAAENLRLIEKLYPGATIRPEIRLPAALDGEADEDAGRLALARGHIECLGPVTPAELAARTGLSVTAMNSLLAQLEGEGSIIRGHFRPHGRPSGRPDSLRSPGSQPEEQEWCDRRLLARIHRLTLDRLRQEIEPVSIQDLTRFLLRWQHVAPGTQYEGKRGLLEAVTQLQGFDIPAVAWERHILPARVAAYKGSWLDDLCFSGDITWARLGRRKTNTPAHLEVSKGPRLTQANSATPISLTRRADLRWLIAGIRPALPTAPSPSRGSGFNLTGAGVGQPPITESTSGEQTNSDIPEAGAGRDILDLLQARGALFYDDIVEGSRRLPTDVERGLWDLVARGLVTADGFQALRSLMASTRKRNFRRPQRARLFRTLTTAGTPSGRWSLLPLAAGVGQGFTLTEPTADAPNQTETPRSAHPEVSKDERRHDLSDRENTEALAEAWAEQLLFRYGVVFRDLTQRESFSVPWREILRVLRRMEAQGLVRGGRFVAGVYGEQYARPEAVEALRKARRTEKKGEIVRLSAVDPLNIVGTVIPVARPDGRPSGRITAIHTNTVVYRDGLPIASAEVAQEPIRLAAGR